VGDALGEVGGRRAERWIRLTVEEAYIHRAKHVPRLAKRPKIRAWGTHDDAAKGGDYFRVKAKGGVFCRLMRTGLARTGPESDRMSRAAASTPSNPTRHRPRDADFVPHRHQGS
jgi:hypothetical protein